MAERVSDERCESSPGSNDSLVGYQVRLDSARCVSFYTLMIMHAVLILCS